MQTLITLFTRFFFQLSLTLLANCVKGLKKDSVQNIPRPTSSNGESHLTNGQDLLLRPTSSISSSSISPSGDVPSFGLQRKLLQPVCINLSIWQHRLNIWPCAQHRARMEQSNAVAAVLCSNVHSVSWTTCFGKEKTDSLFPLGHPLNRTSLRARA